MGKIDPNGRYETFSAHLPSDYISPNERIIEVFESGINQFIVSQDSASANNEGIRIYKYENYTQSAGVFELPAQLRNAYFQAYFKFGKIYVFFVESGVGLRMLKVNPATFQMEENIALEYFTYDQQTPVHHYKKTHVLFEDENNMQVFSSSISDGLVRIRIVDNVPQVLESSIMSLMRILGVNESNDQLICQFSSYPNIRKFHLGFNQSLEQLTLTDSLEVQTPGGPSYDLRYANNNAEKELFVSRFQLQLAVSNVITETKATEFSPVYSNLSFFQDKPLLFGYRQINNSILTFMSYPLIISYGDPEVLMAFKEYSGIYDFGAHKLRSGIGNVIMATSESGSALGDFIFERMVYSSSLALAAKIQGTAYGLTPDYMQIVYKPGPYTNLSAYDQETVHLFHENFYIDKEMVYNHVASIANNTAGYVIPRGILHWPAHGDTGKGQSANLAPYADVNNNQAYEPELGEYPVFPGTRCLLNITHQHENDVSNQGLGIELHNYIYNFDCDDTIRDIIFYKTEVFNRSSRDIDSLGAGIYNDFDLGGYADDYVGTHVTNGLIYAYNGDNYDDGQSGLIGFNDSLPTVGNLFLKGIKFAANTVDDVAGVSDHQTVNGYGFGDGVTDNEHKGLEYTAYFSGAGAATNMSDPNTSAQVFNYLQGNWRFGDEVVYGGTGFPGSVNSTTMSSRYSYPGDSDPMYYGTDGINPGFLWDELSNGNPSGDRRIMGSFGTTALNQGEKLEYHFAYLAGKRIPGNGQSQLDLFAKAAYAKNAFNRNETSCGQSFGNLTENEVSFVPVKAKTAAMKLYPNPATDQLVVQFGKNGTFEMEITDVQGKTVQHVTVQGDKALLDVSSLQKGIYLVKITSKSGKETLKFIKN